MTDSERFSELLSLPKSSLKTGSGVGILGEKYLHAVLKSFFEPDPAFHEQKAGRFTADILRDGIVTEIQTRSLDKLRPKLDYYLCEGYRVRVVLPLPHIKWLIWVDPETGELGSKRRSGRRGSFYDAFWELYKIKDYLGREGVSVCLVLVDLDEYRWLNGFGRTRKRRSTRMERRPVGLGETAELICPEDYGLFIPKSIFSEFTADEFALAAGIAAKYAWSGLKVLEAAGCIELAGKRGRKNLYRIKDYLLPLM